LAVVRRRHVGKNKQLHTKFNRASALNFLEFERKPGGKKDFSRGLKADFGWRFDFRFVSCPARHLNSHAH
jgi:hypothetical protein